MKSKRMLMGAAFIGCLAAATMSGAYAQEDNNVSTNGQLHNQGAGMKGQINARAGRNHVQTTGQLQGPERNGERGFAGNTSMREHRDFAEERGMRGERQEYGQAAAARFGRNWRGERGDYARVAEQGRYDRGWRGDRWTARDGAYRDRWAYRHDGYGRGVVNYGYRTDRLYAYAPGYDVGYTAVAPSYAPPPYDAAFVGGPYYGSAWNVAYGGPYYDYAPDFGIGIGPVGIGIGPFGVGFGPWWGW